MEATGQPVAWIIAKPSGTELRLARRAFVAASHLGGEFASGELGTTVTLNVPHLTIELLYPPLPDIASLCGAIGQVASRHAPCRVPALGVAREDARSVAIELALTAELAALRSEIAGAIRQVGGHPHADPDGTWRPHLSVIGREDLGDKWMERVHPESVLAGFRFAVGSLTLSLPADEPGQFREFGPYRLQALR